LRSCPRRCCMYDSGCRSLAKFLLHLPDVRPQPDRDIGVNHQNIRPWRLAAAATDAHRLAHEQGGNPARGRRQCRNCNLCARAASAKLYSGESESNKRQCIVKICGRIGDSFRRRLATTRGAPGCRVNVPPRGRCRNGQSGMTPCLERSYGGRPARFKRGGRRPPGGVALAAAGAGGAS